MKKTSCFIKIRNYHIDSHGHVNNARYIEFIEESSWEHLEQNSGLIELFKHLMDEGVIHVVVNINCNYKSSAVMGDTLRVETDLKSSSIKSFTWSKKIYNDLTDQIIVDANVTCVFVNSTSNLIVPINHEMYIAWPELLQRKGF